MYRVVPAYPCEMFAFYISQNITAITIMMPAKSADLTDRSPKDIKRGDTITYTMSIALSGLEDTVVPLYASATQPLRTADMRSSQVWLHGGFFGSVGWSNASEPKKGTTLTAEQCFKGIMLGNVLETSKKKP